MGENTVIRVENVSKTFHEANGSQSFKQSFVGIGNKILGKKDEKNRKGDYAALKDISFEIKKGEFFGIVGRNGSGKSTLLKIIAGIYTPSLGAVQVRGSLTPFIELGVGFNPELSGRDNVFLNGALLGFTRKQVEVMYEDIVEFAELKEFMNMKLKNYSSGMQVRLAFSVAIRAESDILLIDEVLAVGDSAFQKKCFDYFEKLKQDKKTVILVTHDMASVERFCDKVLVIDKSKMIGLFETQEGSITYKNINSGLVQQQVFVKNKHKKPTIKDVSVVNVQKNKEDERNHITKKNIVIRINKELIKKNTWLPNLFSFAINIYNESGNMIISGKSDSCYDITKINEIVSVLTMPFLRPGTYYLYFGIYGKHTSGKTECLEATTEAVKFDVEGTVLNEAIVDADFKWEIIEKK